MSRTCQSDGGRLASLDRDPAMIGIVDGGIAGLSVAYRLQRAEREVRVFEAADYWFDGLAELFPQFDPDDANWVRVARNPRTAPVYERGYLEKVVPYDLGDAGADGVYNAGMASRAQYPERSLSDAVEAGFACADRITGRADGHRRLSLGTNDAGEPWRRVPPGRPG